MYMSVAGVPIDAFKGVAQQFVDGLLGGPLAGKALDPYAIYGGQAAQVLLDAIAASDGTRADVIAKLFEVSVTDGLLGSFDINENGDPEKASGAVVGFTIYVATEKLTVTKAGMAYRVTIHVQADPSMPLDAAHVLSGKVKSAIRAALPQVQSVLVHMEPYEPQRTPGTVERPA